MAAAQSAGVNPGRCEDDLSTRAPREHKMHEKHFKMRTFDKSKKIAKGPVFALASWECRTIFFARLERSLTCDTSVSAARHPTHGEVRIVFSFPLLIAIVPEHRLKNCANCVSSSCNYLPLADRYEHKFCSLALHVSLSKILFPLERDEDRAKTLAGPWAQNSYVH